MTLRSLLTRRIIRKEANFTPNGARARTTRRRSKGIRAGPNEPGALVFLRRFAYADFVAFQQYQYEMADPFVDPR